MASKTLLLIAMAGALILFASASDVVAPFVGSHHGLSHSGGALFHSYGYPHFAGYGNRFEQDHGFGYGPLNGGYGEYYRGFGSDNGLGNGRGFNGGYGIFPYVHWL